MTHDLAAQLASAYSSSEKELLLSPFQFKQGKKNELLFFFKPECFIDKKPEDFAAISLMALSKIAGHQTTVAGALLLGGQRLEELSIMDRHYGFINTLSRRASGMLAIQDKEAIAKNLGIDLRDYAILGGHEFLNRFTTYDPESLNTLWLSKKSSKLRSGFYFQAYQVDGSQVVLVNGFHPSQLAHFTNPSHKIIILLLESDAPWKSLKDDLAGDTYPERANPESIRGELFKNQSRYHAGNIAISNNYIHLSAGPFEALFEINNFLSRLGSLKFSLAETHLARAMASAGLTEASVEKALTNPASLVDGKNLDIFTATENLDTSEAIARYRQWPG